ncbi:MAG: hypothetical protein F4W90_00935 [Gammaproteobacteria bacterium]|nr:hypothetical protein [Gammaproteobacteria bacterium]
MGANVQKLSHLFALVVIALLACSAHGQRISDRNVLSAMETELQRAMSALSTQPDPPFYLSYEVTDSYQASVAAMFGEISSTSQSSGTYFDIDLRVGEPNMDNTHVVPRRTFPNIHIGSLANKESIRNALWLLTDRAFKQATEQLVNVRTKSEIQIDSDGPALDLAPGVKVSHSELERPPEFSREDWEKRLRRVSAVFKGHLDLLSGSARAFVTKSNRYFVNSESSKIQSTELMYTVILSAGSRADDGANLNVSKLFHARRPAGLPSDKELTQTAEEIVTSVIDLRNAPNVEPYTGPAILSGRASGVLFHEILGHRLEGHRLKQASDAQTFKDKVNQSVLPASMSVVFDPQQTKFGNIDLIGSYAFDNEGIAGQRVQVIENGVLKRFLLGRSTLPEPRFRASNGHGRKAVGYNPVSRQSNLIVEVEDPYTAEELEAQLIELIKERDLEYGLYFDDIIGGYTITTRNLPNSFTVRPVIVYKIYQDGTRELVRGVDLIGTPLAVFDSVIAAADDMAVFNGQCGAESGNVPVSAIAPSMLVGQIEVQRTSRSRTILPILPPPEA